MEFLLTVTLLIIAYQITVNRYNKKQIRTMRMQISELSDKVSETNQHYEMILLYGKNTKETQEEIFKEEESLIERTGEAPNKTLNEGTGIP